MVGRYLCEGKTDKMISQDLGIKTRTVKKHIGSLCKEFGIPQRFYQRIPLAVKLYQYPIFTEDLQDA